MRAQKTKADKKCPHCRARAFRVEKIDRHGNKIIYYVCVREALCAMEREAKALEQAARRRAA